MYIAHWPLFGLPAQTPMVELRYPDDRDVIALAELAAEGIDARDVMAFSMPWTDDSAPLLQGLCLQPVWRTRAPWASDDWSLPIPVVAAGEMVGVQDLA